MLTLNWNLLIFSMKEETFSEAWIDSELAFNKAAVAAKEL
jgi:hypothetical protein